MKLFSSYVWFLGVRYGLSRKHSRLVSFISRLSIIGLVVSVALLIVVMSIMNGFDKELRTNILSIMPHASIFHRGGIENPQELTQQIESNINVEASSPFVQLEGLVSRKKNVVPVILFGIDPELEQKTSSLPTKISQEALQKFSSEKITFNALVIQCIIGVVMLLMYEVGWVNLFTTVIFICIFLSMLGLIFPNTSAMTLEPFSRNAGTASALMGSLQLGMGAMVTGIVNVIPHLGGHLIYIIMLICCVVSILVFQIGTVKVFPKYNTIT